MKGLTDRVSSPQTRAESLCASRGRETEKKTADERHEGGYGFPEAFHILERLELIESFTFVEGKALGYRLSSAGRRRPGPG